MVIGLQHEIDETREAERDKFGEDGARSSAVLWRWSEKEGSGEGEGVRACAVVGILWNGSVDRVNVGALNRVAFWISRMAP